MEIAQVAKEMVAAQNRLAASTPVFAADRQALVGAMKILCQDPPDTLIMLRILLLLVLVFVPAFLASVPTHGASP